MQFVKLSERTPTELGQIVVKTADGKKAIYYLTHNPISLITLKENYIEWLDEGLAKEGQGDCNEWKEECERLAGIAKYWQEEYHKLNPGFIRPKLDHL